MVKYVSLWTFEVQVTAGIVLQFHAKSEKFGDFFKILKPYNSCWLV